MMLVDDAAQPAAGYVDIDLGCADVGVAEHRLNAAQVSAPFEEVSGKGVAQYVRSKVVENAYRLTVLAE